MKPDELSRSRVWLTRDPRECSGRLPEMPYYAGLAAVAIALSEEIR